MIGSCWMAAVRWLRGRACCLYRATTWSSATASAISPGCCRGGRSVWRGPLTGRASWIGPGRRWVALGDSRGRERTSRPVRTVGGDGAGRVWARAASCGCGPCCRGGPRCECGLRCGCGPLWLGFGGVAVTVCGVRMAARFARHGARCAWRLGRVPVCGVYRSAGGAARGRVALIMRGRSRRVRVRGPVGAVRRPRRADHADAKPVCAAARVGGGGPPYVPR